MKRRSSRSHFAAMLLIAVIPVGCGKDVAEPPAKEMAEQDVAAMPDTATKAALASLGELTSSDGLRPYQIRPPAGYGASTHYDADGGKVFRWAGKPYNLTSTLASLPYLDVTLQEVPSGKTTAEREILRKLKKISATKSAWRQSEVTSCRLNRIPFLHCTYEFSDRLGSGTGFLYVGMDGNTVISLSAAGYTPGNTQLEIAAVSARTIQKGPKRPAVPPVPAPAQPVGRWKTFEPLPDEPLEFHPLPIPPEPVPDDAEMAQLAEEDKLVAEAMEEARSAELGVFVRFEEMADGSVKALINAGATPDARTNWTLEQRLTFGNGIPILPLQASWQVERQVDQEQSSPQLTEQGTHYRLHKIDAFEKTGRVGHGRQRQLLWSPDGNHVVTLTDEGHLTKIDVNTWRVVAAVRPSSRIRDIAWSSQGLIALQKRSDSSHNAKPWAMIEPHPDQTSDFESHRLLVVDPTTLEIRRAYRLEGQAVIGHSDRDLIYVHQERRSRLLVVNVARGELVNMVHSSSLVAEKAEDSERATGQSSPPHVSFADLRLIRGGREMLSMDSRFGLHRFLLTGPRISCSESAYIISAGPIKVSEDGKLLAFLLHARNSYPSMGKST